MVVVFTTTCAISSHHHKSCEFEPRSCRGILDTTLCNKVYQWLATGRWFSPGTPVSSTNKTDRHNIAEILLRVALNTINQTIFIGWNLYRITKQKHWRKCCGYEMSQFRNIKLVDFMKQYSHMLRCHINQDRWYRLIKSFSSSSSSSVYRVYSSLSVILQRDIQDKSPACQYLQLKNSFNLLSESVRAFTFTRLILPYKLVSF